MESATKWNIAFVVIGILGLLAAIFIPLYLSNRPENPGIEYNKLNYVYENQRTYYNDLVGVQYSKRSGLVSETKITKPIPKDKIYYNNELNFELQFLLKKKIDTKVRSFLVDPRGIIRYEYPKNIIFNFTGSDGSTNVDKKINFNIKLVDDPSLIVDGQWNLNTVLIDEQDHIIAEVIEPININSRQKDFLWVDLLSIVIPLIAGILIFLFFSIKDKFFKSNNKTHEDKNKFKIL